VVAAAGGLAAAVLASAGLGAGGTAPASTLTGIHKIRHVIVIMQENRSFDSYFGTFPGADGIPMKDGEPTVCSPDPLTKDCIKPYHDTDDRNAGGPHDHVDAAGDIDGGKMDGFMKQARLAQSRGCRKDFSTQECAKRLSLPDVMGYHDQHEIPNYWQYATDFVLQDHMFQPDTSWSLPAHLFMVSEWSAKCTKKNKPMSCRNAIQAPGAPPGEPQNRTGKTPIYAWTDLTYLLYKKKVSWRYYVFKGIEPDCEDDSALTCAPVKQDARTPGIWNPLPWFDTVQADGQLKNVTSIQHFYEAAHRGQLPAVSWVIPNGEVSEHPPSLVSKGEAYVTSLVNAVMSGPQWKSTAIFISWDDWGGFYDHVRPPVVDVNGYGLRVPGLLISPYARKGYIDHQILSFDAYAKFIEDDFLGGSRLDPKTDGRPDPRPTVRDKLKILGDLASEFDFTQSPRDPELLPVHHGK
jgi:phospholipase C